MMGHVGDPCLGLAALGDIDHRHEIAVAPVEGDPAPEGQHMDFAAVGLEMPPVAARMIDVADAVRSASLWVTHSSSRPDLAQLHGKEVSRAVAVMLHGRVVDAQELRRLGIEHPHRHRIVVEQQAERGFAPLERRDVRDGQRENVAEGCDAQPQIAIIAVDFELVAAAVCDDIEQSPDHFPARTAGCLRH